MELTQEQIESCRFIVENFVKADNFFPRFREKYGVYKECVIKSELTLDGIFFIKGVYKFLTEEGKIKSKHFDFKFYYGTSGEIWDTKKYLRGKGKLSIKNDTLHLSFLEVKNENHWEVHVDSLREFAYRYRVDSISGIKIEKKK